MSPAEVIVVSEFVEGGVLRKLLHDPRKLKGLTHRWVDDECGVTLSDSRKHRRTIAISRLLCVLQGRA